jgi:predicted transcriptional regulator
MASLAAHEEYLYRNMNNGYLAVAQRNPYSDKLEKDGHIKHTYNRGLTKFYKLTKSGWDIIKNAKKIFG